MDAPGLPEVGNRVEPSRRGAAHKRWSAVAARMAAEDLSVVSRSFKKAGPGRLRSCPFRFDSIVGQAVLARQEIAC